MSSLGGYLVDLKLQSDQSSFDKGKKNVESIGESLGKVASKFASFVETAVKGFGIIGGAALGAGSIIDKMISKQNTTAQLANLNTKEYQNWAIALNRVSGTSEEVISGAGRMQHIFDLLKTGEKTPEYETLAKQLALLGISMSKFQEMSNNERLFELFRVVEGSKGDDFRTKAALLGSVLGGQAERSVYDARAQGSSVISTLSESEKYRAVDQRTVNNAIGNNRLLNTVGTQVDQLWQAGLTELLTSLKPLIEQLSAWLLNNKESIIKAFQDIGILLGSVADALSPLVSFLSSTIGTTIKNMTENAKLDAYKNSPKGIEDITNFKLKNSQELVKLPSWQQDFIMNEYALVKALGIETLKKRPLDPEEQKDFNKISSKIGSVTINMGGVNITDDVKKLAAQIQHSDYRDIPLGVDNEKAALAAAYFIIQSNLRK